MEDLISSQLKQKVATYEPPENAKRLVREVPLLLVAGTAGSGKNSLIEKLLETGKYRPIISHTTRQPRPQEQSGAQYFFIDVNEMEEMIEARRFVEVKLIHQTQISGTSIEEVQKLKGGEVIGVTDIDVQGVAEYAAIRPDIRAVFLLPPSHDEWMRRLATRGNQDQDELQLRLESAERELEHALEAGNFHFIINTQLDKAAQEVMSFAEDYETAGDDDVRVEHAWHVLGELKQELSS